MAHSKQAPGSLRLTRFLSPSSFFAIAGIVLFYVYIFTGLKRMNDNPPEPGSTGGQSHRSSYSASAWDVLVFGTGKEYLGIFPSLCYNFILLLPLLSPRLRCRPHPAGHQAGAAQDRRPAHRPRLQLRGRGVQGAREDGGAGCVNRDYAQVGDWRASIFTPRNIGQ